MSKSNVLELAKKLVAAIEEEDRKNKVMLKDIPVGGKFDTGIGRFIVLEQKEDSTVVITEGLYREDVKFDDDCTDYKKSSLRELCEGEILNEFSDEFGEENICTNEAGLVTVVIMMTPLFGLFLRPVTSTAISATTVAGCAHFVSFPLQSLNLVRKMMINGRE